MSKQKKRIKPVRIGKKRANGSLRKYTRILHRGQYYRVGGWFRAVIREEDGKWLGSLHYGEETRVGIDRLLWNPPRRDGWRWTNNLPKPPMPKARQFGRILSQNTLNRKRRDAERKR